jgi:hypothetical protein
MPHPVLQCTSRCIGFTLPAHYVYEYTNLHDVHDIFLGLVLPHTTSRTASRIIGRQSAPTQTQRKGLQLLSSLPSLVLRRFEENTSI